MRFLLPLVTLGLCAVPAFSSTQEHKIAADAAHRRSHRSHVLSRQATDIGVCAKSVICTSATGFYLKATEVASGTVYDVMAGSSELTLLPTGTASHTSIFFGDPTKTGLDPFPIAEAFDTDTGKSYFIVYEPANSFDGWYNGTFGTYPAENGSKPPGRTAAGESLISRIWSVRAGTDTNQLEAQWPWGTPAEIHIYGTRGLTSTGAATLTNLRGTVVTLDSDDENVMVKFSMVPVSA